MTLKGRSGFLATILLICERHSDKECLKIFHMRSFKGLDKPKTSNVSLRY